MFVPDHLATHCSALRADSRGTALTEFAILLPVLLLMYLGGFQLIDAFSCSRRVSISARALADLTSQYSSVTDNQMTDILKASALILTPYDNAGAQLRVSQIKVDASAKATVSWSRSSTNTTSFPVGTEIYGLPPSLTTSGTTLIYSEVNYTYKSVSWLTGAISFKRTSIMMPRRSAEVNLQQ